MITCFQHFREASKTQELLRVKCKEMLSQNYSKRYEGIIDDPDINLWPAPLKIADQTINSMTEFRVRISRVQYNLEYYGFDKYLGLIMCQ